ncbi:hypothetical protein Ais01nite_10020 [Asanoa ishikariensis]|uniref:Uncharacterized protein n=1 Tax=Asanoa ishikariensis TaxID=137265 RepID=A0A1H3T5Q0_9ACTN|nr:hypothetical protein [Asanoa ishikariensis]GIF62967.1 hypothetical protein Ais01nite_10020 [Asanoa ishikariensis]SDZ45572.1 hypothetical protein SAMN05421684_5230 [Asanoa ishikariensis]
MLDSNAVGWRERQSHRLHLWLSGLTRFVGRPHVGNGRSRFGGPSRSSRDGGVFTHTPLLLGAAPNAAVPLNHPTKTLCALVYTDDRLRDLVREHFTDRQHQSWAPCYAIDLVALLRHAALADRLYAIRDWVITTFQLLVMIIVSVAVFGPRPQGLAAVGAAFVAIAVARISMVRAKMTTRRAYDAVKQRWMKSGGNMRLVATAVVGLALAAVVLTPTGRGCGLVVIVGMVASWLVAVVVAVAARLLAVRVKVGKLTRAPALAAGFERRARSTGSANLLIYARDRAKGPRSPLGPFVGAGHQLATWRTPLVDTKRARSDDAIPHEPKPVNLGSLYDHLRTGIGTSDVTVNARVRLYVDGRSLTDSPERGPGAAAEISTENLLEASPAGPPRSVIDQSLIDQGIRTPTDYQRAYLCFEMIDRDGHVVVTTFVRAVLLDDYLHLEVATHALPEVIGRGEDEADALDRLLRRATGFDSADSADQGQEKELIPTLEAAVGRGLAVGTRTYWPTTFGAMARATWSAVRPLVRVLRGWHHSYRRRRGATFDFGAQLSFREALALGQHMHVIALGDTLDRVIRLNRRLTQSMAEFLIAHDISSADFLAKVETVINNVQNNYLNDVTAGAISFGSGPSTGTAHTSGGTPPASQSAS